jgi:large subunit ribosomal protein L18
MKQETRNNKRLARVRRIRAKINGTLERPRIRVFRSLKCFSAQVIDDSKGNTLLQVNTCHIKEAKNDIKGAELVGKLLAEKCIKEKIVEIVFDRAGYKYHGKVKAFAEALRKGGLKF